MCAQNPINGPGILRGSREGTNSLCKISKKKMNVFEPAKKSGSKVDGKSGEDEAGKPRRA